MHVDAKDSVYVIGRNLMAEQDFLRSSFLTSLRIASCLPTEASRSSLFGRMRRRRKGKGN